MEEKSSLYFTKNDPVVITPLSEYDVDAAKSVLLNSLTSLGVLDKIKEGMTVVIKANLVSAMKPEESATTHPTLLIALTSILKERGARVIIGDSPGGLYNSVFVGRVYRASGMHEVEKYGAELNDDYGQSSAEFDRAHILHTFTYTSYLDKADMIINFAKLKSHGMMGMSCAAKNLFGTIPGVIKPEYHYRFPKYEDFADMLLDLDEYFHPTVSIADAVVGMEGNGPTAGTPKKLGFLLASTSPHTLDMLAAHLLGFKADEIPTLERAKHHGLIPADVSELNIIGSTDGLFVTDFEKVVEHRSLQFSGDGKNPIKRFFAKIAEAILKTKPALKDELCVGCGVCANICPAKAIVIKDKKAKIDRTLCIRCFCCQEFCPKSAMKVKRTVLAKLFHNEKRGGKG